MKKGKTLNKMDLLNKMVDFQEAKKPALFQRCSKVCAHLRDKDSISDGSVLVNYMRIFHVLCYMYGDASISGTSNNGIIKNDSV